MTLSLDLNDTKDQFDLQPPRGHCEHTYGWVSAVCDHGTLIHIPMSCGRCAACLARKAYRHACRLEYAVGAAPQAVKIELTSRYGSTWPQIMTAWSNMSRALRRTSPDLEYAAVKEVGDKHGMKHLHIICVNWNYLAQKTISRLWRSYTGAYVVWVRKCAGPDAAYYAAKYLSKAPPRGLRSITYSLGFPKQVIAHSFHAHGSRDHIPDDMLLQGVCSGGILVEHHAPACRCLPEIIPISDGERIWLASKQARSSPRSQDASVGWCYGKRASAA